jgi:Uma2 family endonuclease
MSTAREWFEEKERYTYAVYLDWDDDFRAEIINGVVYEMAPPVTIHQRLVARLHLKLGSFLEGKTCEAFVAPFGVRLFPKEDRSDTTVVEPDIIVVCDPGKIDERGCNGPPDLIIEILSPSPARKDRLIKFNADRDAKVREFWIVSPEDKGIETYVFDKGRYFVQTYGVNEPNAGKASALLENERAPEIVPVSVLPGLEIDVKEIFR